MDTTSNGVLWSAHWKWSRLPIFTWGLLFLQLMEKSWFMPFIFIQTWLLWCVVVWSPAHKQLILKWFSILGSQVKTRSFDHATPICFAPLASFISGQTLVLLMTSNTVNGLASSHLSDLIKTLYPTSCTMLSEYKTPVCAQSYKEVIWLQGLFLSCSFPWNDLPADIRQSDSIEGFFKCEHKSHFFALTFCECSILWWMQPHTCYCYFFGGQPQSLCTTSERSTENTEQSPFYSSEPRTS